MTEARLSALEAWLLEARAAAEGSAVLVEGRKDLVALEALGIGGRHVAVNQGKSVQRVLDELAQEARVLLLLDWDRTGNTLAKRFSEGLQGRTQVDAGVREALASACQSRAFEHIPAEIRALRARFGIL